MTTQAACEGVFSWIFEEYKYPRKAAKLDPATQKKATKTRWYHLGASNCTMLGRSLSQLVEVFVGQGMWERQANARYKTLRAETVTSYNFEGMST